MMSRVLPWLFFIVSLLLGLYLRDYYASSWIDIERDANGTPHAIVYQVEADAYARLARVQRILNGDGLIQRFHPQENFPTGIFPTVTLPFDLLILALYFPAKIVSSQPLDWAGALVSPLLYVALASFIFWWSKGLALRARALLFFGLASLPGLIWATPFARPDHQSLNLVLFAMALCLEFWRWREPTAETPVTSVSLGKITITAPQAISALAGICWGLGMWDSLYEPLLLFVLIVAFNLIIRRREQWPFLAATGVVLLIAYLVEGFHIRRPPVEFDSYLSRWMSTIGELRPMTADSASVYFSPAFWLLPLFAIRYLLCGKRQPENWLIVLLTTVLTVIAFVQSRWIYFTSFALLFLITGWYAREKITWLRRTVLGFIIVGVLYSVGHDMNATDARETPPTAQLRRMSQIIQTPGGILAPWWLSPTLLYYSGQPIVAGSSHMTIPGIVDTAEFFTTTSWNKGDEILQKRQVRWVLVYVPERTLMNSYQILGTQPEPTLPNKPKSLMQQTLAERLYSTVAIPTRYKLRAVDDDCKLYEYDSSR